MRKLMLVLVLAVSSLALSACGAGRVEIVRERGSDVFNVTVELNEADMAELVAQVQSNRDPFLQDVVVDLQAGQIEIAGTIEPENGGGAVNGRIVVVPSVQDGLLVFEVIEVDFEGIDVPQEHIDQFNANLAERIQNRLENRQREITMTGVTVTDDLLVLTFDAERMAP